MLCPLVFYGFITVLVEAVDGDFNVVGFWRSALHTLLNQTAALAPCNFSFVLPYTAYENAVQQK